MDYVWWNTFQQIQITESRYDDVDEAIMNKDTIYQRIRQECINRNLTFKDISEEIKTGVEYGFIIFDEATNVSIYGNILSNKIEGDKIYQAITKTLYDFYDLND